MNFLTSRLPPRTQIFPVYAVICFCTYSWTMLTLFWKFPSWLYDLTIDEMIGIGAYSFAVNLFDSLFALGLLLLLCWALPARFLKNDFIVRSSVMVICVLGSMMLHLYTYRFPDTLEVFASVMQMWWGVTLLILAVCLILAIKVQWIRKVILDVADRLMIFTYIFLPLSLISIVIVIVRNIF